MRAVKVIADASFLMIPGTFRVDVLRELDRLLERKYELMVPESVLEEVRRLAEGGRRSERAAARVGLTLANRGKVVRAEGSGDSAILKLASKVDVVGTTDAQLRGKLRARGIPVIYLRQRSHLALDGRVGQLAFGTWGSSRG